jgi:N-methylhydantoinase A
MMLSNGGVVSAADAASVPIRLVESGPAAGAFAGSWFARQLGEPRLLCFDMGGTTAKSCLIKDFEPELTTTFEVARMYRFKKGSDFPVSVPSVDLVEIGAGGGSLARVDELGLLKVGPESSGADPGPASYARGGTRPAVTDADVLLGLLDPDYFLGGDMLLGADRAAKAIEPLAAALGLPVDDTARRARRRQPEHGRGLPHARRRAGVDLRGVAIIAFPAAPGPCRAGLAELLDSDRVIFPVNASVLSAFGTLVTPVRIDWPARSSGAWTASTRPERDAVLDGCGPRGGGCSRPPVCPRRRCASATASTPATPGRATRSPSGWARVRRGRRRRRSSPSASTRSTSASTA